MSNGLRFTAEQIARFNVRQKYIQNRAAATPADVEPDIADAPLGAQKAQGCHTPCRITIHSIRTRLADADGISGKAAIDGIVHAGLLPDDSPEYVKEVSYSQRKARKGEEESTVITLETMV